MHKNNTHKVAMSGATGFVGSHLERAFQEQEWEVVPLRKHDLKKSPEELAAQMQGTDAVVNLAGAPVISRWTEEYKKVMYESRISVTKKLITACSLMDMKPKIFISTSAVGYYSSAGIHTEKQNVRADDFLGQLTHDWEKEALKARDLGMRTIIFRFGIVLGRDGGALKQMLTPFRLGLGGTIGDGSQPLSWIHIKDLIHAYLTVINDPSYEGLYNLTAPNPTTNKGLTRALGSALSRPTLFRIPAFVLRLKFSDGAQMLTQGQTVIPERLLESGFTFSFPEIDVAVKDCVS